MYVCMYVCVYIHIYEYMSAYHNTDVITVLTICVLIPSYHYIYHKYSDILRYESSMGRVSVALP